LAVPERAGGEAFRKRGLAMGGKKESETRVCRDGLVLDGGRQKGKKNSHVPKSGVFWVLKFVKKKEKSHNISGGLRSEKEREGKTTGRKGGSAGSPGVS